MDLDRYRTLFVSETREHLQNMSENILRLADTPSSELYEDLFRSVHSIKGMASSMGADALKQVSHEMEAFLARLKSGELPLDQESIILLLRGIDTMESMIGEMEKTGASHTPPGPFQVAIRKAHENHSVAESTKIESFRVETKGMDRLVEGLAELMILNAQMAENLPEDPAMAELQRLSRKLYEVAADLRMLPFEVLSRSFSRLVLELGRKLNKKVRLQIHGSNIRMDKCVLEELTDPLIHLIRNAVDHGIESPGVRASRGKEETGTIQLLVERYGDRVMIVVEDDGDGIHVQSVKEAAIRNQWLSEQSVSLMNEQEILLLMTRSGFTTTEAVSDISGRGVGLDVVRSKIEWLGGSLLIRSAPGAFTRFEIRVPLTLAVFPAVLIRADSLVYAVPLSRIERFVRIRKKDLIAAQGRPFVVDVDQMLYVSSVESLLSGKSLEDLPEEFPAFVTEHQNRRIAWAVEDLIGQKDILVRPVGEPLGLLACYSGAAILEKGEIVPVLDMEHLYKELYS